MLGFILSKMNLLILVVAVFAIVSYFTTSFILVTIDKEAQIVVDRAKRMADSLVNSPSYCDSVRYALPPALSVSGGEQFYVMKISASDISESGAGEKELKYLVFQIFRRKDPAHAIAADSFITSATIRMFGETDGVWGEVTDGVFADPQAAVPTNEIIFVKEVVGGQPIVYIIPCNSGTCTADKDRVGKDFVRAQNLPDEEGGFRC
ncbi:MAG: hypothetical protein V1676_03480 [Candidatus Diapherotrites archaeon]